MNTTKKTILFLSIISLHGSAFAMFDSINKKMSTPFTISRQKQVAMAILVPLTVTGCVLLAQHKDDISPLLEKIPVPSEKIIFALATAAGMSTTYVLSDKFSPDQQFKLYQDNDEKIKKHPVVKHRKALEGFISNKAPSKEIFPLQKFINYHFSDEVDKGVDPSIKAAHELCDLQRRIKIERQRLKQIQNAGTDWGVVKTKSTHNSHALTVTEALAQLSECNSFIKSFRGEIINLSEYRKDRKCSAADKRNQLREQKINGSTWSSIVPIFTQPFMLLFQILLNGFGLL